jgi:hypothetical protein
MSELDTSVTEWAWSPDALTPPPTDVAVGIALPDYEPRWHTHSAHDPKETR